MFQHAPPPPSPSSTSAHAFASLPEGWTTACDPRDGRLYYWNSNTGQTSWTHPRKIPPPPPDVGRSDLSYFSFFQKSRPSYFQHELLSPESERGQPENPLHASRQPDSHECYSFTALLLFAPIGIAACYHSIQVNRKWRQGRYGEAVNHARQAPKYACFGVALGIIVWTYILAFREETKVVDWQWPDWNFDFNFGN